MKSPGRNNNVFVRFWRNGPVQWLRSPPPTHFWRCLHPEHLAQTGGGVILLDVCNVSVCACVCVCHWVKVAWELLSCRVTFWVRNLWAEGWHTGLWKQSSFLASRESHRFQLYGSDRITFWSVWPSSIDAGLNWTLFSVWPWRSKDSTSRHRQHIWLNLMAFFNPGMCLSTEEMCWNKRIRRTYTRTTHRLWADDTLVPETSLWTPR